MNGGSRRTVSDASRPTLRHVFRDTVDEHASDPVPLVVLEVIEFDFGKLGIPRVASIDLHSLAGPALLRCFLREPRGGGSAAPLPPQSATLTATIIHAWFGPSVDVQCTEGSGGGGA